MSDSRAQIFTVEGVLAALVIVAGIAFALQATVLTPTTGGTSEAPVDASTLSSLLRTTAESGDLRTAVVDDWGTSGFSGASGEWYTDAYPSNAFGDALDQSVGPTAAVNVVLSYRNPSEGRQRTRLVYNGEPGDGAVRSSTVLTVYDRDVSDPSTFYAADVSPGTELYTVVEVEVVAWQR